MLRLKICLLFFIMLAFTVCSTDQTEIFYNFSSITSYRDIPGITAEEIASIEAVKEHRQFFNYGMMLSTESFTNFDGEIRGYAALICEWLEELFGIPFIPQNYLFGDLLSGMATGDIDFVGFLMDSDDRRDTHFMTHPIAYRTMLYYRIADSRSLSEISRERLPRYAFITGAATTSIVLQYATYDFEVVTVDTHSEGYEMMRTGEIDALIAATVQEINFINYPDIIKEFFFPLIYTPVSLSTQNPELKAFISVVQKALENGADRYLNELYRQGYQEYTRQLLYTRLTGEERAYVGNNPIIPISAEFDNYPLSFYDNRTETYQGIVFDILREVEAISGLEFTVFNEPYTPIHELINNLYAGETKIISNLFRSPEREESFLWSDSSFLSVAIALISLAESPSIGLNEVYSMRVGLAEGTAFDSLFTLWFPDHRNIKLYANQIETFNALMNGEVDMVMSTVAGLRWMTNYLEQPGFKANIVFNDQIHNFTLGYNREAELLHSIVNKALLLVDIEAISGSWLLQTYDFRVRLFEERMQAQLPWIIGAIVLTSAVLVLVLVLFIRSRNAGKILENLVQKRTGELALNQKMLESALEEANTASRAKSDFLAKMSHEIRTPMNAIIGMAELALRAKETENAREHVFTVKQAGFNLLSIINDILDFSKIETGKLEIFSDNYYLLSLSNDVISIIRMRAVDKRIRFVVYIDSKLPGVLTGDEGRIRQVLLNILSNAVKYTEKGFVSFSINAEKTGENEVNLIFEIKDSGVGIKQDDINKLFEEYTQFDLGKHRDVEGTGLGLAITNSFVRAMNGNISVESKYGEGSTFKVTLPQKVKSWRILAAVENPDNINILLYERREINHRSIIGNIANLGVNYDLALNDIEFNEKIMKNKFSFIFISYYLYKKNTEIISAYGGDAEIVVLTEFGEAVPDKYLLNLAMPVHSISIADIINGVSTSFTYNDYNYFFVRFQAPDAKVLVVDDIGTNLKVAEGLLSPYMMQIELCNNGHDAINLMKTKQYDLVFMDHKMPDMDGIETTRLFRAWENEQAGKSGQSLKQPAGIPIVALTANAVVGTKEMFLTSGFNDFISKPIDTVEMNLILERWIPQEKQKKIVAENSGILPTERDLDIKIEGVNTSRGLSLSGGKIEQYLVVLEIFYKDGLEKINTIRECLDNSDIDFYTVHVHALKSASANIGAGALSEEARALELAGDNKDIEYIKKHNGYMISNLEKLLSKIKEELDRKKMNSDLSITEPLDIISDLEKLNLAIQNYNAGEMNQIINHLQGLNFREKIRDVIDEISENILLGDFEMAVEKINELIDKPH